MIYYDEQGNVIPESEVDLAHGYLEDKDILHHDEIPRQTHLAYLTLPSGNKCVKEVVDQEYVPAWDEVTSQIYHYTGPTPEEKLRADVDDLMNIGEAYRTSNYITADTWTFMGATTLDFGVYEITGSADEYKAVVDEKEVVGDIVLPEKKTISMFAKAEDAGTYTVIILKK